MAEKEKIFEQKVKMSGLFDFKEVYQFVYRWLVEEKYDVEEQKYSEEVTGDSKKIEIVWEANKKISDYFKNQMKLAWRIIGMKSVEVEKNGKKVKTNQGTFEVKISGTLIRDWGSRWDVNPFMKFLRGIYDEYIIKGTMKKYEIKLIRDVDEITEQVKAFLTIEGMK
ncbi:hypothetical protein J4463_00725 [Candidatus Pacearchaeota archaeon]|nr:hypothetical protein [Candidatus Pacearchaeota archaeon]